MITTDDVTMVKHYTLLTLKYEVKLVKRTLVGRVASKCTHDFDCDLQCENVFFHCVNLTRVLFPQVVSYLDEKVLILCY